MSGTDTAELSGYVLEVVDNAQAITFRRDDMTDPEARAALLTMLGVLFQIVAREQDIDAVLTQCPADWPYIGLRVRKKETVTLEVFKSEREPGKDSGKNPVINRVATHFKH
jgi:hypothetical protein